ncbi:Uncharacterised protein [Psychrobacter phenylpyruvicus]|uniref:Uncharacterized protein n=1 Tax=Psychrobacter phenylpyruvicus TaxID=29432 RepID=A0A379LP53_9GAMM|nr:Uncharacterised protein [Psychrobacter phenylpyruvicus]
MKLNVIQPYKLAPIVAIHLCCMTAYAQTDTSTINQLEQAQFEQRKDLIKQISTNHRLTCKQIFNQLITPTSE